MTNDPRPWHYRCRPNWLMAKPWQWNMCVQYRYFREPARGRLHAAWLALTFPHVHHESED